MQYGKAFFHEFQKMADLLALLAMRCAPLCVLATPPIRGRCRFHSEATEEISEEYLCGAVAQKGVTERIPAGFSVKAVDKQQRFC